RRPRDRRHQDLRPPLGLAELDLHPRQRHRRARRPHPLRQARTPQLRYEEDVVMSATQSAVSLNEKIPNNVNLSSDRKLQRALEQWLPNYLSWWQEVGPEGFQSADIYLRTAISVESDGWAPFAYAKMPHQR